MNRGCSDPLTLPVLVLNRNYQPVRITTCRRAIRLLCTGSARVLDDGGELFDFKHWLHQPVRAGVDDELPIVNGCLRVPRIVHLQHYARFRQPVVRLTRRNLLLRDEYACQYCLRRPKLCELDIDHVMPRSRGGSDSWENLVTACTSCNRRKAHRTPLEAGMPLRRNPLVPRWSLAVQLLASAPASYKEWDPFLKAS